METIEAGASIRYVDCSLKVRNNPNIIWWVNTNNNAYINEWINADLNDFVQGPLIGKHTSGHFPVNEKDNCC